MESFEKAHNLHLLDAGDKFSLWSGGFYKEYFKRILDVVLAIVLLPLLLPTLLLIFLLVKLDSRGPAVFKSERIGRDGKKFFIFKFRTMCLNAEERLKEILYQNPALAREWELDQKLRNDPRITRFGKIIRALSLDELPQIFNVLRGEMSFVGPRPIVEAEIEKYGDCFKKYTSVKPGITGLWQINGRNDTSYESRIALDSRYVNDLNLNQDLFIILKTIPVALSKKGAY